MGTFQSPFLRSIFIVVFSIHSKCLSSSVRRPSVSGGTEGKGHSESRRIRLLILYIIHRQAGFTLKL